MLGAPAEHHIGMRGKAQRPASSRSRAACGQVVQALSSAPSRLEVWARDLEGGPSVRSCLICLFIFVFMASSAFGPAPAALPRPLRPLRPLHRRLCGLAVAAVLAVPAVGDAESGGCRGRSALAEAFDALTEGARAGAGGAGGAGAEANRLGFQQNSSATPLRLLGRV